MILPPSSVSVHPTVVDPSSSALSGNVESAPRITTTRASGDYEKEEEDILMILRGAKSKDTKQYFREQHPMYEPPFDRVPTSTKLKMLVGF